MVSPPNSKGVSGWMVLGGEGVRHVGREWGNEGWWQNICAAFLWIICNQFWERFEKVSSSWKRLKVVDWIKYGYHNNNAATSHTHVCSNHQNYIVGETQFLLFAKCHMEKNPHGYNQTVHIRVECEFQTALLIKCLHESQLMLWKKSLLVVRANVMLCNSHVL